MTGTVFQLNGKTVRVAGCEPSRSLLSWLRDRGLTGSKEGCAEGECGACAVALLGTDAQGRGCYKAINSCLFPLPEAHGHSIWTIEGIRDTDGGLHPVQSAMASQGGSQCGYCTPGFVVSLFCEYYRPNRSGYDPESIGGNLCRCTGYRPIVDVARGLASPQDDDPWKQKLRDGGARAPLAFAGSSFARPGSLDELFGLLDREPNAVLVAGATDSMVEANQRHVRHARLVSLTAIAQLRQCEWQPGELVLGAGLPLSELEQRLTELEGRGTTARDGNTEAQSPSEAGLGVLRELLPRFSSRLIRNRATLGGNLATASPIGDAAPALMALDAEVTLVSRKGERRLRLEDFFTGYRKTALTPGELIASVHLPRPFPGEQRFYKVSKRPLDDISTVAAAFGLTLNEDGTVHRFTAAYGGVADTPLRARAVETWAIGKPWNEATLTGLLQESDALGTPLSDHRGSAAYRRAMIRKLLERFYHETQGGGAFAKDLAQTAQ